MADPKHIEILKRGVETWNEWRQRSGISIKPDLSGADLKGKDLSGVQLWGTNLKDADLTSADLGQASLSDADLSNTTLCNANVYGVSFSYSVLENTDFTNADLSGADFTDTDLSHTTLTGADLSNTDLSYKDLHGHDLRGTKFVGTHLTGVNLSKATLAGSDFTRAVLIDTDLSGADLSSCEVFGVSAWDVNLTGANQSKLTITKFGALQITVDQLEVAQFIYLLLQGEKLRNVIDAMTTKVVLILGRFSDERRAVLDAIAEELRKTNGKYIPIIFTWEPPNNRNYTETIVTLAHLSRFVIADLSDPNSVPHEIKSFIETLRSVPVQPIFSPVSGHLQEYPLLQDLSDLPHVLSVERYKTKEELITGKLQKILERLEKRLVKIHARRRRR